MTIRRGTVLDLALALAVVLVAGWQLSGAPVTAGRLAVAALAAVAAGLARPHPAYALAVIWLAAVVQVTVGRGFGALEIAVAIVSFCTARYGARSTVWLAGASIPAGAFVAVAYALTHSDAFPEAQVLAALLRVAGVGLVGGVIAVVALLGAPWVLGLLFRLNERYRRAAAEHRIEQAQAEATTAAQAAQTRLTREVHDVVGHSLAVIIAQADAARFAATSADPLVRDALERIAAVGRSSLAEVRDVLSRTSADRDAPAGAADLDELVSGVRAAGNDVAATVTGAPVALDPAGATAAYRVLQELLTNALKHGAPGGAIRVDQTWTGDGLTLRVTNPASPAPPAADGMGLTGVRSRLDAVGGTLRTTSARGMFTAVAYLPLRAGATL